MQQYPLWLTPERKAILAKMAAENYKDLTIQFYDNLDMVVFNGIPSSRLMDALMNRLCHDQKEYWKADDRDARSYLWKLEKGRLHRLDDITHRGQFDSIARANYLAHRPLWEIVGIGIDAFSCQRVAKIRIPSLDTFIWVTLDLKLEGLSKNKLRKIARYGGKVPQLLIDQIESICRQAVIDFINKLN